MQLFVLLGIALCLVADTSTKSVTSTDHETGTGQLSVPEHGNIDSKAAAEECECKNGFCEKNDKGKWVCKCPPEWGLYTSTSCTKCDCGKDSNCTFLGLLQIRKTCLCKVGYKDVDGTCKGDCSKNPCKNGGTCQVKNGEVTCQCKEDFGGEDCSIRTCQSDSNCMNGGKCGASNICSCLEGTKGDFCEEISECKHMDCGPEARCTYDVERQQAMCSCENHELLFDSKQRKCRRTCYGDSDCRNGARCEENGRGNFCRCLNGTEGDFCEEVSECKGLDCGPDARCTYDTRRETAMCSCQNEDLVFDERERRCKNVCYPNPCKNNGTCNATGGEATCQCKSRFRGGDCSIDVCSPNPCRNGGVCNVTREGAICQCRDHFTGADCSIEIPVIVTSTTRNSTLQPTSPSRSVNFTVDKKSTLRLTTIVPTTGTEECECHNGFCEKDDNGQSVCKCPPEWGLWYSTYCQKCNCGKGSNCTFSGFFTITKTCICKVGYTDVNGTCRGTCNVDSDCRNGARCEENGTGKFCRCLNGTEGDFCEEVSECKGLDCGPDARCTYDTRRETAMCSCQNEDLVFDERERRCKNVCYPNPCKNNGTCNATRGKATCDCKDRFRGDDCSIDVCSPNSCKNNGTCNAMRGVATCECKDRFRGADCSIDVCYPNPCKNNGTCKATRGEATCQCKSRFRGGDCSIDVCWPNPCRNGGVCSVTREGVVCQCRDHFTGADCSIEIPVIATSTTRNSTLQPTSPSRSLNFTVDRESTLRLTTIVPTTGTDPCTESPCLNGGTCVTVGNTRKCFCKKPYLGNLCETDPCDWNPCKNGGMCKIEYETARCFCREPFTGEFCESVIGVRSRIDTYVIALLAGTVFVTATLTFLTCILCQRYHAVRPRSEES